MLEYSAYPALFQTSDTEAIKAQKYYKEFVLAEFALMILATILSSIGTINENPGQILVVVALFALMFALFVRALNGWRRFDQKWFSFRAIAEAVKEETWRYISKAEPYNLSDNSRADSLFTSRLEQIRNKRLKDAKLLDNYDIEQDEISELMRETRNKPFDERKKIYQEKRVIDQKKWYGKKANNNGKRQKLWFWFSFGAEVVAITYVVIMLCTRCSYLNPVGILITASAIFIAWAQINRHRELRQAYTLVAQNLGLISSKYKNIQTEEELSFFVNEIERTVSEEHMMWLAKRE